MKYLDDTSLSFLTSQLNNSPHGSLNLTFQVLPYSLKKITTDKSFHKDMHERWDELYKKDHEYHLLSSSNGNDSVSVQVSKKANKRKNSSGNLGKKTVSAPERPSTPTIPIPPPRKRSRSNSGLSSSGGGSLGSSFPSVSSPPTLMNLTTNSSHLHMGHKKNRELVNDLILCMNNTFTDYDFSHLTSESFAVIGADQPHFRGASPGVKQMKDEVASKLNEFLSTHLTEEKASSLESHFVLSKSSSSSNNSSSNIDGNNLQAVEGRSTITQPPRGHQVLNSLWTAISNKVSENKIDAKDELDKCEVYSYIPNALIDGDCPLTEGNPLWSFNFFIYSRANNMMIFFYCTCSADNNSQEDPNETDLEHHNIEDDSLMGNSRGSLLESSLELNRRRLYELDANDCDSPTNPTFVGF